jgi:hypothetical protein
MIRIAIDLELESDGKVTGDIIELGYCIFKTTTREILYTGFDLIKVPRPLDLFIINLTGITDRDLEERGVPLHKAYDNMVGHFNRIVTFEIDRIISELGPHSKPKKISFNQIIEWGSGDVSQLKRELHEKLFENYVGQELEDYQEIVHFVPFKNVPSEEKTTDARVKNKYREIFCRASLNLKAVFQMQQIRDQRKHSGGLSTSLKEVGLKFEAYKEEVAPGKFRQRGAHRAMADAMNTARMYLRLSEIKKDNQEELKEELRKIKVELEKEKKIVDHYAFNGYSFAVKRIKER